MKFIFENLIGLYNNDNSKLILDGHKILYPIKEKLDDLIKFFLRKIDKKIGKINKNI